MGVFFPIGSGGGGGSYIDGTVPTPADLPITIGTPAMDAVYLAKAPSGIYFLTRKPAGLYCRTANAGALSDWTFLGSFPEVNSDANWRLYNNTTTSKQLAFNLSGISASTTSTLTVPNESGTVALTSDFVVCRLINVPTITGTGANNALFNATTGAWTGSPTSYAYQWQISDNGTASWTNISGATSATYQAVTANNGQYVRVGVIASNSFGAGSIAYSAASSAISVPANTLLTGLLAFWKLSDTSDSSGNNNTLTNNGSVPFTAGLIGNAATVSDAQSLTRSMTFSTAQNQNWSASAWFYETSNDNNAAFLAGPDAGGMFWFWTDGTYVYVTPTNFNTALGGPYNASAWNHVVASVTPNVLTLYVNGTNRGSTTWTGTGVSTQIRIGVNLGDQAFYGKVDAVGLWTRALTAGEALALYNSGSGIELN